MSEIRAPRARERKKKFLEPPKVRAILQAAWQARERDGVMLEMCYFYGFRVSELVRLQRADYRSSEGRLWVEASKGSVSEDVHVPPHLRVKLDRYLAGRTDHCPALFVGRQGALSTRLPQTLFDRYALAAGVELGAGQSIHALRHSIACHLIADGREIFQVQKHLRHKSIKSTMVYADIMDEDRKRQVEAMAASSRVVIL